MSRLIVKHLYTVIIRTSLLLFAAICVAIGLGFVCRNTTAQTDELSRSIEKLDVLYDDYLKGDIEHARQSMREAEQILNDMKGGMGSVGGRAHGLMLVYARLYCIESKAGNSNEAYINHVKSKYWFLIRLELEGVSKREIKSTIESFTEERCREIVTKFDKARVSGKGPRYLE